jgi:hypothetical protein
MSATDSTMMHTTVAAAALAISRMSPIQNILKFYLNNLFEISYL